MPHAIAHRGLRHELPENTCESIAAAIALPGIHGVEFDIELTDTPVVVHQESMLPDPMFTCLEPAPRNFISRDWVSMYSADQICQLDAGRWFAPGCAGCRVPSLPDLLTLAWGTVYAYAELKDPTYWGERDLERPRRIVDQVGPLLAAWPGPVAAISFNPQVLRELSQLYPQIPRVLGLWVEWSHRMNEALETARYAKVEAVSLAELMVRERPEWVMELHRAGFAVHVYPVSPTVDEPAYLDFSAATCEPVWARLIDLEVDAIISDFPRELVRYLSDHTHKPSPG